MTKQVQRRRGTATQHTSFTGAEGELSVNTTNKSVHVHDNVTAGGFEAARADMDNVTSSSILTAAGITATTTELNYVDGVTSAIQTQLDGKAGTASPTFTGTLTTANLTATGTTTLAGASTSADITFGDNDKAIFGAGSDLQIYHDGSNSYIQDTGTGGLYLKANADFYVQSQGSDETFIQAASNAFVKLFYNGSEKLATTSTGIDVTGTVTADGLTVDTAIATSTASFRATSNSTTIGQKIGSLDFFNGTTNDAGTIEVRRASGGNAYSDMSLVASANGNRSNQLLLSTNGNISFYEDTGTTAKFFWDASAESLGIGTSSPSDVLHVNGGSSTDGILIQNPLSGSFYNAKLEFTRDGTSGGAKIQTERNAAGGVGLSFSYTSSNANEVSGTYSEAMRITSSGSVGIGTSSPDKLLHLSASSGATIRLESTTTGATTGDIFGAIEFETQDTNSAGVKAKIDAYSEGAVGNTSLRFFTGDTSSLDEAMRIDSSGNVGIGSASDGAILQLDKASSSYLDIQSDSTLRTRIYNDSSQTILETTTNNLIFKSASSEAMRIDSSGNVGIGTTSPSTRLTVGAGSANGIELGQDSDASTDSARLFFSTSAGSNAIHSSSGAMRFFTGSTAGTSTGSERMRITSAGTLQIAGGGNDNVGEINMGNTAQNANRFQVRHQSSAWYLKTVDSEPLIFGTGNSERMRLDASGNLLVGTTSTLSFGSGTTKGVVIDGASGALVASRNGDAPCYLQRSGSDGGIIVFYNDTSVVGSISVSGSSTAYNTSSDHRLKENVVELTGATDRIKQLEPKRFNFIADADTTVDGFLAHEVQSVVPEAITGTHNEVDADGNPVYQGIDQSKLVPLLVATIKELEARITALENA